jgi:hypothetical protein
MNSLCWLGEGWELGAVEVNLTYHQLKANQQRENQQSTSLSNSSEIILSGLQYIRLECAPTSWKSMRVINFL